VPYQLYKGYFASNSIGVHFRSVIFKEIGRDWPVASFKLLSQHSSRGSEENVGISIRIVGSSTESRMIRSKEDGAGGERAGRHV
jgi:hypothetical protein